jgi:hypothetical protein
MDRHRDHDQPSQHSATPGLFNKLVRNVLRKS